MYGVTILKINQFVVTPYSIPFIKPLQTARHTYSHREGVRIKLTWENCSGYGEAAPLIGFSTETLNEVNYALEGFHQAITGVIFDKEEFLSIAEVHTEGNPAARFAIETAIYDLQAKKDGLPLATYLNPNANSEIAINGIAGIHMPDDGYKVIKGKVGFRNLFDEIEQMEQLTEFFGNNILFRLDANGSFDLPRAIRFCKAMETFNIDFIEQPLPADNLEDLEELTYHTEIPIAVDESLTDFNSAEGIIVAQAAHVFVIKPMVSGGFRESKKIIQLARSENIRTVITSSLETSLGRLACLHLAAENDIIEACGLSTGALLTENYISPSIENGIIRLPDSPGMGWEL